MGEKTGVMATQAGLVGGEIKELKTRVLKHSRDELDGSKEYVKKEVGGIMIVIPGREEIK